MFQVSEKQIQVNLLPNNVWHRSRSNWLIAQPQDIAESLYFWSVAEGFTESGIGYCPNHWLLFLVIFHKKHNP